MNDMMLIGSIPGFTSNTANINGVRLHYLLGGDPNGPPVLLWHGFLSTSYGWRKVAPTLVNAGFAVLVPDMRGYGDSDKPPGTEGYDARALAEDFRALVREIGFGAGRPLTLAAHDMGAPPALLWAADHPEEVAGLLYIEAPVMLSEVLTEIIAYTPEAMKDGSMWWWILPLAPDVRAAFTTIEQTALLTRKKVQAPVVALGGEKAQGGQIQKMAAMIAENVDGASIADCSHFVPEERPDEIVRHVLAMTKKSAIAAVAKASRSSGS